MVTFAAFLNTMLYSSILVLIVWLATRKARFIQTIGVSTLLILLLLLSIRIIFPFEFPFTQEIYSRKIMTTINSMLQRIGLIPNETFFDTLWLIAGIIALWKIAKLIRDYVHLRKIVSILAQDDTPETQNALSHLSTEKPLPRNLKVIRSSITYIPMVLGYMKPVIILPMRTLSEKETYYILKHELQHLYKKDTIKKLVLEILCGIYWWFPVISILLKRLCATLIEYYVDSSVTNLLGERERIEYLNCILQVAKDKGNVPQSSLPLGLTFIAGKRYDDKGLTKRFDLVLKFQKYPSKIFTKVTGLGFAIILLFFSVAFVIQPHYDVPEENENSFVLEDVYLVKNEAGIYIIYDKNGQKKGQIDTLIEPFTSLPIYEQERNTVKK